MKNNKGFTLTELLITLAIIGIVSPLIFTVFISGIEDYSSTNKFVDQQYKVNDVIRYIRQDFEESKTVVVGRTDSIPSEVVWVKFEIPKVSPTPSAPDVDTKVWTFYNPDPDEDNTLSMYTQEGIMSTVDLDSLDFIPVVDGLDISQSKFEYVTTPGEERLKVYIKPKESNKKYKGRNINEQIITEFSVRHKYFDLRTAAPVTTPTPGPTPTASP